MVKESLAPMDPAAKEGTPTLQARERNCYALNQLVKEVTALFPETSYEVSNRDGRGVAHDVQFQKVDGLDTLLELLGDPAYNEDPRITEVIVDEEYVLVSFRANPRVQDDRSPFGLAEANAILFGGSL
jgi:hypothetical protein